MDKKRAKLAEEEEENVSNTIHLGQIQRVNLDFDFDKVCSVTLSPRNVYCCLVCGKYLQGKSASSPLMVHALQNNHFVCISLTTCEVFSLPEDVLVVSDSLEDIKFNLRPSFTLEEIRSFGAQTAVVVQRNRDLHGNTYFTGLVGMQGLDYINAVVQSLARVDQLRDFFLQREGYYNATTSVLVKCFGDLVCQMFNHRRFKSSVCPNELMHVISSNSKFSARGMDASQFLAWFLHELNRGLGKLSSVIYDCFQGEVSVKTTLIEMKREFGGEANNFQQPGPQQATTTTTTTTRREGEEELGTFTRSTVVSTETKLVKFMSLGLELPTNPLFKDSLEGQTVIPQTTLLQVLEKYNGETTVDSPLPGGRLERKRYKITRLPKYLVLHLKRFTQNQFFLEKNRALVSLPVANLDMSPYCNATSTNSTFDLIANVCHSDGSDSDHKKQSNNSGNALVDGAYKANVYYAPKDAWFEMNNIQVKESMPQLVAVSETFLAFYKQKS